MLRGAGVAAARDGDGDADGVGAGREGTAWVGRGVGLASAAPLGDANALGSVQAPRATTPMARSASAIRCRSGRVMCLPWLTRRAYGAGTKAQWPSGVIAGRTIGLRPTVP